MRAVQPVWEESEGQQTLDYENNSSCLFKQSCLMMCIVHMMRCCYDTRIYAHVLQSDKCFNGEVNSHYIFNAKQPNKNGKVQEAVMMVLSYGSVSTDYIHSCNF